MSTTVTPGLVSVVVASYNHEKYLARRMDSLCVQTYKNMEIIVIDDCSPDGSRKILQNYKNDPRVTIIEREENGGWVTVSNQGIDLAKGEFVLFANCDDDCEPEMIGMLVNAIQSNEKIGIAYCRSLMIDQDDVVIGDDYLIREAAFQKKCFRDCQISSSQMQRFLLYSCVIPNLSSALIRKSCFEIAGRFSSNFQACSDWDLFFKIAETFEFYYVAIPLNRFRQHDTTVRSATKGRVTYDEFFRVLLIEIANIKLTLAERLRFRTHVMYLWSMELLRPSISGWVNFPHHFRLVWKLDRLALPLLPIAMVIRLIELPRKALKLVIRKITSDNV